MLGAKARGPAHEVKAHIWACIFIPWPTSIPSSSGFCICVLRGWVCGWGYLNKVYMWFFFSVPHSGREKETGCCILKNREKGLPPLRKIIFVRESKEK